MNNLTVLIPVYNTNAPELIECVFSLSKKNQTIEQEYDIVLVDDCSTNLETIASLKFLETVLGCKVLKTPENLGTSGALNLGHEYITTEYIALSGSSDISNCERLKIQMDHLQRNPSIDVLGTNLYSFSDKDIYRKPMYTSNHAYTRTLKDSDYGWLTNHGTVIYKNESVKKAGGYNLGYRRGQDVDLWKRMFNLGMKIHTLPNVLYAWRRDK